MLTTNILKLKEYVFFAVILGLCLSVTACQSAKNPLTLETRRNLRVEEVRVTVSAPKGGSLHAEKDLAQLGAGLEQALKKELCSLKGAAGITVEIELKNYFIPDGALKMIVIAITAGGSLISGVPSLPTSTIYIHSFITLKDARTGEILAQKIPFDAQWSSIIGSVVFIPSVDAHYASKLRAWLVGSKQ